MNIKADFHTHTRYSHGKGTVADNAINALSMGMRAVAITDHAKNHPVIGVPSERYGEMREDVTRVGKELKNIRVLLGIEANIISPRGDIDVREEDAQKLDLLLAGFHLTAYQKKLSDYFYLPWNGVVRYFAKSSARRVFVNTEAIVKAVLENDIDILTHPGFRLDVDAKAIGQACAYKGTYVEISSRHRTPDLKGLEQMLEVGAKFVINSDAHKPVNIGKCKYAFSLAETLGMGENEIVNISDKPIKFLRGLTV